MATADPTGRQEAQLPTTIEVGYRPIDEVLHSGAVAFEQSRTLELDDVVIVGGLLQGVDQHGRDIVAGWDDRQSVWARQSPTEDKEDGELELEFVGVRYSGQEVTAR